MSESETGDSQESRRFRRTRSTRASVRVADRVAQTVISVGGIGTIVAVSMVGVFLVWVILPLFRSERLIPQTTTQWPSPAPDSVELRHIAINEYGTILWQLWSDGSIRAYEAATGQELNVEGTPRDHNVSAIAVSRKGDLAFGLESGELLLGHVDFTTEFLAADNLPKPLQNLPIGKRAAYQGGIVERTVEGQWRFQRLEVAVQEPVTIQSAARIELLDVSHLPNGYAFVALDSQHKLHVGKLTQRKNLLTGKITYRAKGGVIDVTGNRQDDPVYLGLSGLGDSAILVWRDGSAQRFDLRKMSEPQLAEKTDLLPESDAQVSAAGFLIGKTSLVVGDSAGRVRVWFGTKPEDANTSDGSRLTCGHRLAATGSPVTALASSPRSRMLACAFANGKIQLWHVTSEQLLAETDLAPGAANHLVIAPKDDLLVGSNETRYELWQIDAPHPETTFASVFGKVWYEGYEKPEHVWQSSSGTDDFEPKYGLMPLIFGTLKATAYSMLFAVPLALLAAIYSSEFLHPRTRRIVKPTVEIMASLPSVVLGFLAAIVLAPVVEDRIVAILTGMFTVPFTVLLGAYLWQLLPPSLEPRLQPLRLALIPLAIVLGGWSALRWAPSIESLLFASNFKLWLDGQAGSGTSAWLFVMLPLSAVVTTYVMSTIITPRLRSRYGHWHTFSYALLDLAKFLAGTGATLAVAYLVSLALNSLAWDPRGTFVGTYIQRNAFVVGAVMGFAVIPIIFTISDDALSSVPDSLRAGSLGAGATTWQTAIRVVIPTAMSGLFSAIMIGLGRAVGETMIVLMAAGNTPVMSWNIFSGFRTLSANIAVELPEAVVGSTHYRMLFVAALVLFAMTFIVNTIAESIRLRFRKRAFQM